MTIVCFHAVETPWGTPLAVPPEEFEAHCLAMLEGRTAVTLETAVATLDRRWRPKPGTFALTFDDAFRSVYDVAFPFLARHRVPATVFVVAGTLTGDKGAVDWVDRPPPAPLRTLELDQLLELQDAGMTIGSHSHRHHVLPDLSEEECERDLRESRTALEDLLGRPVPFLAYPRGRHAPHVRRAAERAGYTHAFSLPEGPEHVGRYAVPRVGIYPGNSPRSVRIKMHPRYLSVRMSRGWPLLRRLSGRGTPKSSG